MKADDERELTERAAYEAGDETESVPPLVPPLPELEIELETEDEADEPQTAST